MSEDKCRIKRCQDPCAPKRFLCAQHWRMVPWELRRHISKVARKSDFERSSLLFELEQLALSRVYDKLRGPRIPFPELPQ